MIKQLFKIIWNQRRTNGWIFAELLVVLAIVWTLIDGYWVDYHTYRAPLGFDITQVWRFKLNDLSERAPGYVPDSLYTSSGSEDLAKLMDQIRRHPAVDGVCATFYSCPYSNGNSWWGIRPVDGDTTLAGQKSFQVRRVTPEYFDVFRVKNTAGDPVYQSLAGIHNPLIISQDMEKAFYHDESGRGRRVLLDKSEQETTIAAVCQPIRFDEYARSEPCYFQILEGPVLNEYVNMFSPSQAELCVRMKQAYTKEEMNGMLTEMGSLLTVNNLNVYGVQSLDEMRTQRLRYFDDEARQKMGIMSFLLINVFFGITGTFWLRMQNRRGEMGLRIALGATRISLRRFMFLEGICLLVLTMLPVLIYALNVIYLDKIDSYRIPLGVGRFLITFGGTYLLMAGMICLGIWYPVRKTMQMAPADALHYE